MFGAHRLKSAARHFVHDGLLLITLIAVVFPLEGFDDDETGRATLRGLRGVAVIVEPPPEQMEKDGLLKTEIQTDADLRLRRANLRVLTTEEWLKTKGEPYLRIRVVGVSTPDGVYSYTLVVELSQRVVLERNPSIATDVRTWWVGSYGYRHKTELRRLREFIRDQVDRFANAYLSVNP